MSVYNLLALRGPSNAASMHETLTALGYEVRLESVGDAFEALVSRALVTPRPNGLHSVLVPFWFVHQRDDTDPEGWRGWVAMHPATRERRPLSELIAKAKGA